MNLKISKKSIAYKIATKFGGIDAWDIQHGRVDSCQYNRAIIRGSSLLILMAIVATVGSMGITIVVSDFIAWIVAMIVTLSYIVPEAGAGVLALFSSIGLTVFTVYTFSRTVRKAASKINAPAEYKELYSSFKNKYCKTISFED